MHQSWWKAAFERLRSNNVEIKPFAERIVETMSLDFQDKHVYNAKRERVTFNNKSYSKNQQLRDEYNSMESPFYGGVKKYPKEFEKITKTYFKVGILRWAKKHELEHIQINPYNIVETKPNKFSMIIHPILNARYSKPEFSLVNILDRGDQLVQADHFMVFDLSSCYHQFKLCYSSVLQMGIKIDGRVAVAQTAFYGPSPAVVLVNTMVNYAALDASLHFNVYSEGFIDDIIVCGLVTKFLEWLKKFGFIFSESKMQSGKCVEYLGLVIDAESKTVKIMPKNQENN